MSYVFTINSLANNYANKLDHINRSHPVYNFKTMGLNLTTIAMISTFALGILTTSPFFLLLALIACSTRAAFMREVGQSLPPGSENYSGDELNANSDMVAQHLRFISPDWKPVFIEILNFRIWMNPIPQDVDHLFEQHVEPNDNGVHSEADALGFENLSDSSGNIRPPATNPAN